jgi:hypothetical protein
MPILVTGMRSGTSMVMRLLNLCGVYVGDSLLGAGPGNQRGYWEDRELVFLNQDMLAVMGGHTFDPPEYSGPPPELEQRADALIKRLSIHGEPWGMKDPRFCLLLPFWLGKLPEAKVVFCTRHPVEVAASLRQQNRLDIETGLSLWYEYSKRALAASPIVTHYQDYLIHPRRELRRVLNLAGLSCEENFIETACESIDTSLRHFRVEAPIPDLFQELYMRAGVNL